MEKKSLQLLKKYGQQHILKHYHKLSYEKQQLFLKNIESLDFNLVFSLYNSFFLKKEFQEYSFNIKPADIIELPETREEKDYCKKAYQSGESLIREQKVAVLIVAGGQGSRLGFEGPKGSFPTTCIKKKTLFQVFAESIRAINIKYNISVPLLIMTSHENHEDTIKFFSSHNYFGLKKCSVNFFKQGMLPSITPDGKLILKDETSLFTNPDGHGGSLKALHDSGLLLDLIKGGYTELFYCQVDNPLVRIVDPLFLGYHVMSKAFVSTKVVKRDSINEKVGVYILKNEKHAIAEYSDLPPEFMEALDKNGKILYWAGNTAIHLFSIDFIKRINDHGYAVPYHCARKQVEIKDKNNRLRQVDVWKFETFVFDTIPLAERTCCMEVAREEEFAPIKNKDGVDSPDTARIAMCNLHKSWLKNIGVDLPPGILVEISPLFALNKEDFKKKIKGKKLDIKEDIYFG